MQIHMYVMRFMQVISIGSLSQESSLQAKDFGLLLIPYMESRADRKRLAWKDDWVWGSFWRQKINLILPFVIVFNISKSITGFLS